MPQDSRIVRSRAADKGGGAGLSFLPQPKNPIPLRDDPPPEPSGAQDTSTAVLDPAVETAEVYRAHDGGFDDVTTDNVPAQCAPHARIINSAFLLLHMHSSCTWILCSISRYCASMMLAALCRPVNAEEMLAQSVEAGQHVEFKEINADELQRTAPHERSEIEALRAALGSDQAKQVQAATARGSAPSKRQKQRHQIGSLYFQAKANELQDMQRKQANNRSKAHTAAKYGW
jgi:pyruvate/2-oxoglutarate dehydrogenase complex dihydrolipoamide acyltransferase (E2) component